MRFVVTSQDQIQTMEQDTKTEADAHGREFETEQQLYELAGAWPMKRLIAIWNRLPGVRPVEKFENRSIALARIWQAIQPEAEQSDATAVSPSRARRAVSRMAFREGSKAAEVCTLLQRPEGATLDEIRALTGWQAHTVRGFISRNLSKRGRKVRSSKRQGQRVYRVKS